jgi:hypothetical protein
MTTMIIEIPDSSDIRNIAVAVRQLRGVAKVRVQKEEKFKRIPGLPYTKEECILAVRKAEYDYAAGRFVTSDELRKKHPRL